MSDLSGGTAKGHIPLETGGLIVRLQKAVTEFSPMVEGVNGMTLLCQLEEDVRALGASMRMPHDMHTSNAFQARRLIPLVVWLSLILDAYAQREQADAAAAMKN